MGKIGKGMKNKEQRKLELLVKLGAVVPQELFEKYNLCANCMHQGHCCGYKKI